RLERRPLRSARGRARQRSRHRLPSPLRRRRGDHPARASDRGRRRPARPRGDVQGARGRSEERVPSPKGVAMDKQAVRTEAAPAPFQGAPYSQAIRAGGLVFVSGQIALHPGSHDLVSDEIAEQTEQVFANLKAILESAGSGLERIVKTTVYLRDLDD